MSNSSSLPYGNTFGPAEPGGFDFTTLFENTILSILPSSILLLFLPIRLLWLYSQPRKVSGSSLHGNKLVRTRFALVDSESPARTVRVLCLSALVLDRIQVRAAVSDRQDDQLYQYPPSASRYRLGSYSSLWFCLPWSSCCQRVILPYGIQVRYVTPRVFGGHDL